MSETPFGAAARAWREDPAWRARVAANPKAALAEKGLDMSGVDRVLVAVDTPDTMHFVLPLEPNAPLGDDALGSVAGGVPAPGRGLAPGSRDSTGRFVGYD